MTCPSAEIENKPSSRSHSGNSEMSKSGSKLVALGVPNGNSLRSFKYMARSLDEYLANIMTSKEQIICPLCGGGT